ncbi:MAG TPA: AAA family ATPase [Candidatus Thalassarchaeaceae archaeon]|nr:AAA family ATPase [Candidatus Thalassarchaeaceae archaeon]
MLRGPSIALSGAPGSGKSSIAKLAEEDGWRIISVQSLAKEHGLLGPLDSEEDAREIDIDALRLALGSIEGPLIIDGHLSHFLEVDAVAILRCEPSILQARLQDRDYPAWKIKSNVEWELMGGTWAEVETKNVAEFENTSCEINDVWAAIRDWISEGYPSREPFIDWFE